MKLVIYGNSDFAELMYYYFTNDSKYEVVGFCVDRDFINEVLYIPNVNNALKNPILQGSIICLDNLQNEKWRYTFNDSISSLKEKLQPIYAVNLVDTFSIEEKQFLICSANNTESFSSAIFILDLETGVMLQMEMEFPKLV